MRPTLSRLAAAVTTTLSVLALTAGLAAPAHAVADTDPVTNDPRMDSVAQIFSPEGNPHCTGALINPQWVLTAAHCLDHAQGSVGFGPEGKLNRVGFAQSVAHPNPRVDIGLIRLDRALHEVPPMDYSRGSQDIASGERGNFYGWGDNADRGVIGRAYMEIDRPLDWMKSKDTDTWSLMAHATTLDGARIVRGDSGGPLFLDDDAYMVVAVMSHLDSSDKYGSWLAPVHQAAPWIQSTLGAHVPQVGQPAGAATVQPAVLTTLSYPVLNPARRVAEVLTGLLVPMSWPFLMARSMAGTF